MRAMITQFLLLTLKSSKRVRGLLTCGTRWYFLSLKEKGSDGFEILVEIADSWEVGIGRLRHIFHHEIQSDDRPHVIKKRRRVVSARQDVDDLNQLDEVQSSHPNESTNLTSFGREVRYQFQNLNIPFFGTISRVYQ
jgi:hypothetical protein